MSHICVIACLNCQKLVFETSKYNKLNTNENYMYSMKREKKNLIKITEWKRSIRNKQKKEKEFFLFKTFCYKKLVR